MPAPTKVSSASDEAARNAAAAWVVRHEAGLTSAEQTEWEAWLAAAPAHRAAFENYAAGWRRLGLAATAGQADELEAIILRRRAQRRRRASLAVAGLAVALGGLLWSRASWPASKEPPAVVLQPERRTLPDGSVVELRPDVRLTVDFSAGERRVQLDGSEAHFTVAPDRARPFVVFADAIRVRAVGTAFLVARRDRTIDVLVTEGRVAVATAPAAAAQPEPAATLAAGERLIIGSARGGEPPRLSTVSPEETDTLLAWRAPRAEFTEATLDEALALLNAHPARRAAPRFRLGDPALGGVRVSGLCRIDRTEAILRLLEQGFGLTAATGADGDLVIRRAP